MTLIGGFRCRDGLIVAADTELTFDPISYQGHKLAVYEGKQLDYVLYIAYAGDASVGLTASQKIRDAVASLQSPTLPEIKDATEGVLIHVYDDLVSGNWRPANQTVPGVELVIGVSDAAGQIGVLYTDEKFVFEVESRWFGGAGSVLAGHLAEKIFGAKPLSTAVTEHLVQQLFREIKGKGIYVGGNTEIVSRRKSQDTEKFFDFIVKPGRGPAAKKRGELLWPRFLWGLESELMSSVRRALAQSHRGTFEDGVDSIRATLKALREESGRRRNELLERRTTEYGANEPHPMEDWLGPGAE